MEKRRRKFTQCPNCSYSFEAVNNYCPNCGQENHDLNVPVKHLVGEFLEGTMHFDAKVFRTLRYLLLKPGLLTEKFNLGQRASYVPPFRLYVFISLIFFTALALRAHRSNLNISFEEPQQTGTAGTDSAAVAQISMSAAQAAAVKTADSLAIAAANQVLPDTSEAFARKFIAKFSQFSRDEEHSRQKLLKNVSFMMFVLMPFFGFILYLFYYRQRRNYVEHLMFSIHFHTFFFVVVVLLLVVEYFYKGFDVDSWAFGIALLYLYLALHRVYKQSYLRTFFKLLPISFVYMASLVVFILCTLAISIMMS